MKSRSLMLIALLALVPAAVAQDHAVSGQVVDQDGDAIAGVDVYLYQWGTDGDVACEDDGECEVRGSYHEAHAVTDAQGRYSLPARDGWASINFQKAGYDGHYANLELAGSKTLDVELLKFPEKTARIEGRVTGAGNALPFTSISAENPQWGQYECSVSEADAEDRDVKGDSGSGSAGGEASMASASDQASSESADESEAASTDLAIAPGEWYPGCSIIVAGDGTYAGNLTPGYTILRFYHQDWREEGGQQFYSKSIVRTLAADTTTRIDVDLVPRPGPDAIVQGYVVDGATKQAIPDAQISFSSMDAYGWANTQTDKDGSYKVRVQGGVTQVYVYADGYFQWEGDLVALSDGTVRFDIHLTAGESRYGGCCIAYAEGDPSLDGPKAQGAAGDDQGAGADGDTGREEAAVFEDLGGGLGPYDADSAPGSGDAEAEEPGVQEVPGFEVLAVMLGLLALVLLRRR